MLRMPPCKPSIVQFCEALRSVASSEDEVRPSLNGDLTCGTGLHANLTCIPHKTDIRVEPLLFDEVSCFFQGGVHPQPLAYIVILFSP